MLQTRVLAGIAAIAGVAVAVTGVAVGQDVIAQRKELMKQVGGATKTSSEMIKGDKPYDAKAAEAAATTIAENWPKFVKLFPASAKTGGETTAAPKIWEDTKDFEAKGAVMAKAAHDAAQTAAKGPEAFKTSFGEVTKNCKGCHEVYRIPKK
jgi:cytochrome c556